MPSAPGAAAAARPAPDTNRPAPLRADRPEELTAARRLARSLERDEVRRKIIEIDSRLHLEDPHLARRFRRLDRYPHWPTVVMVVLLAASALLLWLAVTSHAWQAGVAGVAAFIATLAVARRDRSPVDRVAGATARRAGRRS